MLHFLSYVLPGWKPTKNSISKHKSKFDDQLIIFPQDFLIKTRNLQSVTADLGLHCFALVSKKGCFKRQLEQRDTIHTNFA